MPVNVDEKIRKLSAAQHKKVEVRAAELIAEEMGGNLSLVAEFHDRAPVVLSGIAEDDSRA